ncbi:MAG: inositol-3-phosphate synthase [Planctomycetota bacterium]
MAKSRLGVWLVGAKGGVATTAIAGLAAIRRGLLPELGLVTGLPAFRHLDLPDWSDLIVGGHEIRAVPLSDETSRLVTESHTLAPEVFRNLESEFVEIDGRIRPGTLWNVGPRIEGLATCDVPREATPRRTVARLRRDLEQFAAAEQLEHVVVVYVASTEPPVAQVDTWPCRYDELEKWLDRPDCPLPASTLYAIAAFEAGCSLINFTPSLGAAPAALVELAERCGTRHMGCDGKTGETLMKSVLGPMFARRNLSVMSWVGHNIFGNLDGRVLDDPHNKQAKIASKDHLVGEILGYRPQTLVSIEYIESLGDWKTAWDHIHFRGFLGTPMTLQFTWQGCDSALAAPLVLDLVRLTDLARRRGQTGLMPFLASFFKSPYGIAEHAFDRQYAMLEAWAKQE